MAEQQVAKGRVVPGAAGYTSRQGSDYTPGISADTVGAQGLWLGTVVLPPGVRTRAHSHEHHESALYFLSGDEVEMWTGERLEHKDVCRPGDYVYVPAKVPHIAINRSPTTPAVFISARNEAAAEESVRLRPELDALVP
jgi:uncharacterized RmlC-like cupin family protein